MSRPFDVGDLVIRHPDWVDTPRDVVWDDVYAVTSLEPFKCIRLVGKFGEFVENRFVHAKPVNFEDFL